LWKEIGKLLINESLKLNIGESVILKITEEE
jgi:hypothetical protein